MSKKKILFFFSLIFLIVQPNTHASIGDTYGFSSLNSALGLSTVAGDPSSFSAYKNPATLSLMKDKKLLLGFGLVAAKPSFKEINNVVIENEFTSDKLRTGSVNTSYRATFGQTLSALLQLSPSFYNLNIGIVAYLPFNSFAYMDTGETYIPEYILYRSSTQKPEVHIGIGFNPFENIYLGLGLQVAFSVTSEAHVFLQTDESKPSTMRFIASQKLQANPYFGFLYNNNSWSIGGTVRLASRSLNDMTLYSGARAFGDFAALDFNFNAQSTLYYDPFSIEMGTAYSWTTHSKSYLQLDFQQWNNYQPPSLNIKNPETGQCEDESGTTGCSQGVNITASINPDYDLKNIFIPRIGHEIKYPWATLRVGYSYKPSIFKSLPTESGNFLDPAKHSVSFGTGHTFKTLFGVQVPWQLNWHLSYHLLSSENITKSQGDENGSGSEDLKIGAPGYDTGGYVYSGGVTLSMAF